METRQSHTTEYAVSKIVLERHRENGIKFLLYLCSEAVQKCTDVPPEHRVQPALAHKVHVEHH